MLQRLGRAPVLGAVLTIVVGVGASLGHEEREVGDHTFVVGMMDEPVFAGQKSGLEFSVAHDGEEPVEGLEETLQAQVIFGSETRDLQISPVFGEPGSYGSVFIPTAAGPYTFRIFGEIDGEPFDESFTAGPETFGEVQEVSGGQFPVQFPPTADVVRDAEAGAAAATQATIALVLAIAALLAALVAIGLIVARRSS